MPSGPPFSQCQVIAADSITAVYNGDAKTLTFEASGPLGNSIKRVNFHRLPNTSGLAFQLQSWLGTGSPALTGPRYSAKDTFNIDLSTNAFPSQAVIVMTANNKAWAVPIQPFNQSTPGTTVTPGFAPPTFNAATTGTVTATGSLSLTQPALTDWATTWWAPRPLCMSYTTRTFSL